MIGPDLDIWFIKYEFKTLDHFSVLVVEKTKAGRQSTKESRMMQKIPMRAVERLTRPFSGFITT